MATKPESAFDQYFQSESNSRDHQAYSGKKNLNVLSPEFSSLLARIRAALNEALRNEKTVTEHVSHPPFYFDYIDSTIPNAIALRLGDCSFIGITMPLVELLWDICVRLSRSDAIALRRNNVI